MILSLVVIGLVGILAYIWASRGFFSALVHMVCTLVAGAVAFGVWEPLAYLILTNDVPNWVVDSSWGVALAVPFAATLAALRLAVDKALPANADLDNTTNLIGGGLCGVVSGTIAVGILVISMSFLRLPASMMGYEPIGYETNGSPRRDGRLLFPADQITAGLYGFMSTTTLRTGAPMAVWRPNLADEGYLLRKNFNEGGSRHTLKPNAFEVRGRYTVGMDNAVPLRELTTDTFPPERPQNVSMMDGTPANANSYIEGFVVQFKAGAREKEGRVVIGNTQIRLVCVPSHDMDGGSIAIHPFAMISQAEGASLDLGRWRFERPAIFIASVGGAAEAPMAFEFVVPKGYTPLALYVKGVRTDVRGKAPFQRFTDIRGRDNAVRAGSLLSSVMVAAGELNRSRAVTVNPTQAAQGDEPEVIVGGFMGSGTLLVKDKLDGLEVDDTNRILQGTGKFRNSDLTNNRIAPRNLQVREFASTSDTKIVQVRVGNDSRIGFGSTAALNAGDDLTKPPVLIDESGQRYQAVGYMYRDSTETHIEMRPGRPINSMTELPYSGPTPSRPDQKFYLVFRVSNGVKLKHFAIGNTVLGEFNPPVEITP